MGNRKLNTRFEADGIVWRALREDERPAKGLKPPKPNGTLSVAEAIERGSKDAPSNYVTSSSRLGITANPTVLAKDLQLTVRKLEQLVTTSSVPMPVGE